MFQHRRILKLAADRRGIAVGRCCFHQLVQVRKQVTNIAKFLITQKRKVKQVSGISIVRYCIANAKAVNTDEHWHSVR